MLYFCIKWLNFQVKGRKNRFYPFDDRGQSCLQFIWPRSKKSVFFWSASVSLYSLTFWILLYLHDSVVQNENDGAWDVEGDDGRQDYEVSVVELALGLIGNWAGVEAKQDGQSNHKRYEPNGDDSPNHLIMYHVFNYYTTCAYGCSNFNLTLTDTPFVGLCIDWRSFSETLNDLF